MVSRGQVWTYIVGSRQTRVLIISSDEINGIDTMPPWGLLIDREGPVGWETSLLVTMGYDDPIDSAIVLIPAVLRLDRNGLREAHGYLSDETMARVEYGLREFLDLA